MTRRTVVLAAVLAAGCSQPEPPRPSLVEAPTHARYAAALGEFGLDKTALGQDWLAAADTALAAPIPVVLPFSESGYLEPATVTAIGYAFELRRGRRLMVEVAFETPQPSRLFVDLFELRDDREPRLVASVPPYDRALDFEARSDATYVLRVQPELLRGGRFTIVERSLASLGFPVDGLSTVAVQSVFGDPRDGGRRDHHGVDIFAPRGTPVLAAADGRVRVDTGNRGGRLIWLSPTGQRRRLYYAHLNDWAIENGDQVVAGQVIGYVGNTGNARTTPPHLHFGVYDRGPVDPYPYLSADDRDPPAVSAPPELISTWARVSTAPAMLRERASSRAPTRAELRRGMVVYVEAASGSHFRVRLPDGLTGYLPAVALAPTDTALTTEVLGSPQPLLDAPLATAALVDTVGGDWPVEVLGHFGSFRLVRLPDQRTGWLIMSGDAQ